MLVSLVNSIEELRMFEYNSQFEPQAVLLPIEYLDKIEYADVMILSMGRLFVPPKGGFVLCLLYQSDDEL